MKIQRTLPPAAAPLKMTDILNGLRGMLKPEQCGQEVKQALKDYFGVKHVFLVSSGKAALTMILLALKALSPERRRVVIPAYTCFSVPSAIVKAGLDVGLCDIDPSLYDYDYHYMRDTVDKETLCVISGNLFGIPSDVSKIVEICKQRGIARETRALPGRRSQILFSYPWVHRPGHGQLLRKWTHSPTSRS